MQNRYLKLLLACLLLLSGERASAQLTAACSPTFTNNDASHFITSFTLGTFSHSPAYNVHDYTAQSFTANAGGTYSISAISSGFCGVATAADFNNDGDFDDAGEILALPAYIASAPATYNYTITIPPSVLSGAYRFRMFNRGGNAGAGTPNGSACGSYGYGGWWDYTVNVLNTATCQPPGSVSVSGTNATSTTLNWTASISSPLGYFWKVVTTGSDPNLVAGISGYTTGLTAAVSGLTSLTGYQAYVKSVCSTLDSSAWTLPTAINTTCTGAPTAGLASSVASICPATSFALTLTGSSTGTGFTYQWQSSPIATTTWTNIAGATSMVSNTTQATAMKYRAYVTCSGSNLSDTSNVITVNLNSPLSCYCTPGTTSASYYITNFSTTGGVTNVNNASGYSVGGYGNFTAVTPNVSQIKGGTVTYAATYTGSTFGTKVWVDWNQNGSFSDAGEQMYASSGYASSSTASFTVPLTAVSGTTRMRIGINYVSSTGPADPCATFTGGEYEDYAFYVIPNVPNNAGISNVTSPLNFCAGPSAQPIKVNVKNFGSNVINTVQVQWSKDGVMQTPINVTTPIDTTNGLGVNILEVTLGTHVFSTTAVNLKAWTTLPNGGLDTVNNNDTIVKVLKSSLNGTFTVNSAAPTAGTNYANFTDLANDLNTFGVCGPIVANVVVGSGPYNETVSFGNISGTSATNTIKINGNGATVQFANTASQLQLLKLNGTQYLSIDSLTFKSLDATYGWAASIMGGSAYDSITRCIFDLSSVSGTSSTSSNGITFSASLTSATTAGTNGSNCYIGNNLIKGPTGNGGPYYGLTIYGDNNNNVIKGNTIQNFYYYGIYLYGGLNNMIDGNDINRSTKSVVTTFYGIYASTSTALPALPGKLTIKNNKIHDPSDGTIASTGSFYGINNLFDGSSVSNTVDIYNNQIYGMNLNGIIYGIYMSTTLYNNVYHNTIDISKTLTGTSTNYGIYSTGTNTGTNFKNNIVTITGGTGGIKYGQYYSTTSSYADVQKNNIYVNSTSSGVQNYGYLTAAKLTLAAFQSTAPTLEIGSPNVNPGYASVATGDFTPSDTAVLHAGQTLSSVVPADIFGTPRSSMPTLGSIEVVSPSLNNAALLSIAPIAGPLCAGNQTLKVVISNVGTNNINPTVLNWTLNGVAQAPATSTATLVPSTSTGQLTDTLTISNVLINTSAIVKFWIATVNGVPDSYNGNDTMITTITVAPLPIVNLGNDTAICFGQTLTLNAGTANSTYSKLWSNAATTQTIAVTTAGTYSVIVTNSGCAKSDTIVVSVNATPVVNLGNDTSICAGSTLLLNAGATNSAYTKLWSNAATTQTISVTTAGTYSVTVTNGLCIKKDTIVVGITPIPVVNLGNDTTICAGSTLTLNAGVANSTFTKLWSTGSTAQSINVTTAGSYNVTVSNGACSKKDTIIVSTAPVPVVNLGNDTSICTGSTLTLNAGIANSSFSKLWSNAATSQTIAVSTAGTYWVKVTNGACYKSDTIVVNILTVPIVNLGNDTAICSGSTKILNAGAANSSLAKLWSTGQTTQSITVNTAGTYSVTVGSGACTKSDTIVITVTPSPVVNLGNDTTICSGNTLILNAGTANSSYTKLWSTGANSQTINVTTAGSYRITVTDGLCSKKDTIVVSVTQTPVVNLGNDTAFCQGSSMILNAGNPNYARIWNTGAATQTIVVSAAGTYSVTVNNGLCYKSDTIVLSQNPLPSSVNLGADTSFCQGNSITLDAGNPGMSYLWNTGATTQTIQANTSGTYSVAVINGFNCSKSDTINIVVDPLPAITSIYVTGNSPSYFFSTVNPINVSSFNWNFGDGSTGTGATPLHTYATTNVEQTFVVTLIVTNNCGTETFRYTVVVKPTSAIGDLALSANSLKLFPNPTAETVTLENESSYKMTNVSIINILGQEVLNEKINNSSKHRMNVSQLATGLYTVKIDFKEGTVTRKLEIIR